MNGSQLGTGVQSPDLSFSDALKHMLNGVRMAARFMPDNIFITVQLSDAASMNTEAYLKMVTVDPGDNFTVQKCEPWEPGRRSIFSSEWYTSKYQGTNLSR